MHPAPTPYDILPVPPIPYAPDAGAWLLLLLAGALFGGWLWARRRARRAAPRGADPCAVLREALERLVQGGGGDALPRASLAVKRYLSVTEDRDLSTLGPRELEREVQSCPAADLRALLSRSEERRVGKECRSRWSPYH